MQFIIGDLLLEWRQHICQFSPRAISPKCIWLLNYLLKQVYNLFLCVMFAMLIHDFYGNASRHVVDVTKLA